MVFINGAGSADNGKQETTEGTTVSIIFFIYLFVFFNYSSEATELTIVYNCT